MVHPESGIRKLSVDRGGTNVFVNISSSAPASVGQGALLELLQLPAAEELQAIFFSCSQASCQAVQVKRVCVDMQITISRTLA